MHFLGALDNVTNGVLVGSFDGVGWRIGSSANFVIHEPVKNQEEHNTEKAEDHKATDDTVQDESGEAIAVEVPTPSVPSSSLPSVPADSRHRCPGSGVQDPEYGVIQPIRPSRSTTYRTDSPFGARAPGGISGTPRFAADAIT